MRTWRVGTISMGVSLVGLGFVLLRFSNFGYEFDDDSAIMVAVAFHDLG